MQTWTGGWGWQRVVVGGREKAVRRQGRQGRQGRPQRTHGSPTELPAESELRTENHRARIARSTSQAVVLRGNADCWQPMFRTLEKQKAYISGQPTAGLPRG